MTQPIAIKFGRALFFTLRRSRTNASVVLDAMAFVKNNTMVNDRRFTNMLFSVFVLFSCFRTGWGPHSSATVTNSTNVLLDRKLFVSKV